MKRVWTIRGFAVVLGGSLLYFLITALVMMCGSFSPLFWVFLPLAFGSSGSPLYIWIDPARTAASAAEEMSPSYAAAVERLATPGMLALMLAAIIVGAAIGAWLGTPLWKRGQARIHIRKA